MVGSGPAVEGPQRRLTPTDVPGDARRDGAAARKPFDQRKVTALRPRPRPGGSSPRAPPAPWSQGCCRWRSRASTPAQGDDGRRGRKAAAGRRPCRRLRRLPDAHGHRRGGAGGVVAQLAAPSAPRPRSDRRAHRRARAPVDHRRAGAAIVASVVGAYDGHFLAVAGIAALTILGVAAVTPSSRRPRRRDRPDRRYVAVALWVFWPRRAAAWRPSSCPTCGGARRRSAAAVDHRPPAQRRLLRRRGDRTPRRCCARTPSLGLVRCSAQRGFGARPEPGALVRDGSAA